MILSVRGLSFSKLLKSLCNIQYLGFYVYMIFWNSIIRRHMIRI